MLYIDLMKTYGFDRLVSGKGEINRKLIYDTLMSSVMKKAFMMLKYDNLPEEIPERMVKMYLMTNGHFAGFKVGDIKLISWGTFGGTLDEYYFPKRYIINNPYIQGMDNKNLDIGKECIIVRNDSLAEPLMDHFVKFCNMLTENEASMIICDILARAQGVLKASNDQQMESAQLYLKRLFDANVVPIKSEDDPFSNGVGLETVPFGTAHYILTDLIEYEQYVRSSLYSELGIRINFNMKRESLNAEETSMDDEILKPYIDNMIEVQTEDLKMLSEFWGLETPITVRKNSVWEEGEKKDQIKIRKMEAEADAAEAAAENNEETTLEENSGETEEEVNDDKENDQ